MASLSELSKDQLEQLRQFQVQLRDELAHLKRTCSRYMEFVGGYPMFTRFEMDSKSITVWWGPKDNRQKDVDPSPIELALKMDAMVEYWGKQMPPVSVRKPQAPVSPSPAKSVSPQKKTPIILGPSTEMVAISSEDFQEYQELKQKAQEGIWIRRDQADRIRNSILLPKDKQDEFRYGYVSPDDRAKILAKWDRILTRC